MASSVVRPWTFSSTEASTAWGIGAAVVAVLASTLGLYVALRTTRRRPSRQPTRASENVSAPPPVPEDTPKRTAAKDPRSFTYEQILAITCEWDPSKLIEDKNHACVHVGRDEKGRYVAVKRAKKTSNLITEHMFNNEATFLRSVEHPNVVQFLGSCNANREQILVFDFVSNGSLASWLRPPSGEGRTRRPLDFSERLSIAIDIAEALSYMHSFSKPAIAHRDVKSDTILLDGNFRGRLGGLGLLKHLPGEARRQSMQRKRGYVDPEYFRTHKITTKSDVFSFGVVLLEMLSGKAPLVEVKGDESGGRREVPLTDVVLPAIRDGDVKANIDPRMPIRRQTLELLVAFSEAAAACVMDFPNDRPEMGEVLTLLKAVKTKSES